ncbi:unnamed protein product, partial [Owenia fusiformis]
DSTKSEASKSTVSVLDGTKTEASKSTVSVLDGTKSEASKSTATHLSDSNKFYKMLRDVFVYMYSKIALYFTFGKCVTPEPHDVPHNAKRRVSKKEDIISDVNYDAGTKRKGKTKYKSWDVLYTKISPKIGFSNLTIFIHLDFSLEEFDTCVLQSSPHDANNGYIRLLIKWDRNQANDDDKYGQLYEAFQESGRQDLADIVSCATISPVGKRS